jgi:hypothetical protein
VSATAGFKASSGKSRGARRLRELFPDACSPLPRHVRPDLVAVDALQGLIGFREGTGADLAARAGHLANLYLAEGCPCVAMCFDRQSRVPVAKSCEQRRRAAEVGLTSEHRARDSAEVAGARREGYAELDDPGIWEDRDVPPDFDVGLQDRGGYRQRVIRFVCAQFVCGGASRSRLRPGPGSRAIVSGHCLRAEDLLGMTLCDEDLRALGLPPGEDPEDLPIAIEGDTWRFAPELKHRLGEGEAQFGHFLRALRPRTALLVSTDSDVLFLGLLYLRRFSGSELEADWRCDPRTAARQYVRLDALRDAIRAGPANLSRGKRGPACDFDREAWRALADPVAHVVAAQSLAGTDYTQGFLGVTHESVLDAAFLAARGVGDLAPSDAPSSRAYVRLAVASWILARDSRMELLPPAGRERDDEAWREHAALATLRSRDRVRCLPTLRVRRPDGAEIPNPAFANRILRWAYHFHLSAQFGAAELELGDLRDWGYGPVGGGPITALDVYPLESEEPPVRA